MNSVRHACLLIVWSLTDVSSVCAAPAGQGEPSIREAAQNRALAEALFRDGKTLVESRHFEAACGKFQESQRLDPALGTLLYLATCYAQTGKTASAWAAFQETAALAREGKDRNRESLARDREQKLEAVLSRVRLTTSNTTTGLKIRVDDRELGPGALSTALPLDPGPHVIGATAPGKQTWTMSFELESGPITRAIDIPPLIETVTIAKVTAQPPTAKQPSTSPERLHRQKAPPSPTFNWEPAGVVTLGVGITGIVAGSYFGAYAYFRNSDADRHCNGSFCNQDGLDGHESAHRLAGYSNVGFAIGIIGIAAGTYLIYFRKPKTAKDDSALWVSASVSRLAVGGAF